MDALAPLPEISEAGCLTLWEVGADGTPKQAKEIFGV